MAFSDNTNTLPTPVFVQNQVLRADDLNGMVAYFENQSRLTRIFTIGIGILKGLDLVFDPDENNFNKITITAGMGISSDGILFELNKACDFSFFKEESISKNAFNCGENSNKRGNCSDEENKVTVFELLDDEAAGIAAAAASSDNEVKEVREIYNIPNSIADYCIVLVHCENTISRKNCFNECEKNGADILFKKRVLLVKKTDLESEESDVPTETIGKVNIAVPPTIERLGYTGEGIDLCRVDSWEKLYGDYLQRCINAKDSILNTYRSTFDGFAKLINVEAVEVFADLDELLNELSDRYSGASISNISDIQYYYAYLRDLTLAYEEFFKIACGMSVGVNVSTGVEGSDFRCAFPGYLSLGNIPPQNQGGGSSPTDSETNCRVGFFPATASEGRDERLERANILYRRLTDLLKTIVFNDERILDVLLNSGELVDRDIRITASCTQKLGLSHQAIPFYLKLANVKDNWNIDNPYCNLPDLITHYNRSGLNENILLKKVDAFDFYRIEGHLGQSLSGVMGEIEGVVVDQETEKKGIQESLNLPFDTRSLLIGPDIGFEDIFADDKALYWGELQEVYQNTRSDLMCKIEEWRTENNSPSSLNNFYDILSITAELLVLKNSTQQNTFITELSTAITAVAAQTPVDHLLHALENSEVIFRKIFEKLQEIVEDLKKSMQFHTFAKDHPGMEHLGGVHRGGTFILVYAYRFKDGTGPSGISDENFIKNALEAGENIAELLNNLEKVVVADFCLPYACCSESMVIKNEITDATLHIFVEREFCFDPLTDDIQEFTFSVSPTDGTISYYVGDDQFGDEVLAIDAAQVFNVTDLINDPDFDFVDGKLELRIEYQKENQIIERTVTIYKKPDVSFEIGAGTPLFDEACNWKGYSHSITHHLVANEVTAATWMVNGQDSAIILDNPVNNFELEFSRDAAGNYIIENFTIQLHAENGVCNELSDVETIVVCPDDLTLMLKDSCEITPAQGPVTDIECTGELLPVNGEHIFLQSNGQGYIELRPSLAGGEFTVTQLFVEPDLGDDVDVNDLVTKNCFSALEAPSYFFVYDKNIFGAAVPDIFENVPLLPALEAQQEIQLLVAYTIPGCNEITQTIIKIRPGIELTPASASICSDENIDIAVAPQGGTISYSINNEAGIYTDLNPADPNNPTLDISTLPANYMDGTMVVYLKYRLDSGLETEAVPVIIHKNPVINFSCTKGDAILNEECQVIGYRYSLTHNLIINEVETAEWNINGEVVVINDLNDGTLERELFSSSLPISIQLIARNGDCENSDSKEITAFCPDEITVDLLKNCQLQGEGKVENIVCDDQGNTSSFPIPNSNPPIYLISQSETQGFLKILTNCPGGEFDVQVAGGQLPAELDPQNFILKKCLDNNGNREQHCLFVYNAQLISDQYWIDLGLNPSEQLPLISESNILELTITYSIPGCLPSDTVRVRIINDSPEPPPVEPPNPNDNPGSPNVSLDTEATGFSGEVADRETGPEVEIRTDGTDITRVDDDGVTIVAGSAAPKKSKTAQAAKPSKKAVELLNTRTAANRSVIDKLGQNKSLSGLKTFGLAKSFLMLPANDLITVNTRFEEVIKLLTRSMVNAEGARQKDWNKIATALMSNYLDKQAVLLPKIIHPETIVLIEKYLPKLKKGNFKTRAFMKAWEGEPMLKALKAKTLEAFKKILK